MQEEKQMERRKKIAVELSELVVYCRPVPFNEDSKKQTSSRFFNVFLCLFVCLISSHICFCPQRSGRRGRVTETCLLSRRRRRRSLRRAAEGNVSFSTTDDNSPEFIPEDKDLTRPTTTRYPCGSVARSWSRSTSRPQVSVDTDTQKD